MSESDFASYDGVLQIGRPPRRIDRLNRRRVPVIGRSALLRNERAAGRLKDLADVDELESQSPSRG